MSLILAIFSAVGSAIKLWNQERSLYNKPEMVKNKLDLAKQEARDALMMAESIASNPNATTAQHVRALKAIRLAGS